ncbi:hypothetical protein DRO66_10320, partial [Candidatus Bathyarchaeota archaeon]
HDHSKIVTLYKQSEIARVSESFIEDGFHNCIQIHLYCGVIDLAEKCNHSWEEQHSNFKETKYECKKCGATQIIPRLLEKHTHESIQDNE